MLTNQRHYDWGLRELKTVLHRCGQLLNSTSNKLEDKQGEFHVATNAIFSNSESRLTNIDKKR